MDFLKIEIPNYEDIDRVKTINIFLADEEEPIKLDEDITRMIRNYAKDNFITLEEATEKILKDAIRRDFIKLFATHPIQTAKGIIDLKKNDKKKGRV